MKRTAHAIALAAALGGGCMTTEKVETASQPHMGVAGTVKQAPNTVGPWGDPVPSATAMRSRNQQTKSDIVQASATGDRNSDVRQVNHQCGPNGCPPHGHHGSNAPPRPSPIDGAVAATGALVGGGNPYANAGTGRTSIRFAGPTGMKVAWFNGQGMNGFSPTMVEAPGRYNFPWGAVYRLKLSDFPNRAGVELYPTLEVIPANSKTAIFLAHSAVPLNITEEDLEQVAAGNFVVKVIYLPDPAYQDLAAAGPDEIVSSRLEPGVDPVAEATRRGSVLAILRLGNIDLEAPNSPRLDAPPGSSAPMMAPRGAISGPITSTVPAPMNGAITSGPIMNGQTTSNYQGAPVMLPPAGKK